jgi:redox-sensitive bicupin YhaK (pirin superfamily)
MGNAFIEQPLPTHTVDQIDPFLLLHYWKTTFKGGQEPLNLGVGPHPHRGFSPVTLLFEGAIHHRDSLGNDSIVGAGGAQWINAGSGIIHSERPPVELAREGGALELIQLWINTPADRKMEKPEYIPFIAPFKKEIPENQPNITNFAGVFEGVKGPIEPTSPLTILRADFPAGSKRAFSFDESWNVAFFQLDGKLLINQSTEMPGKNLVWLERGIPLTLEALEPARILLMAGMPLNEKVVSYGPFVMNAESEINQAYADFRSGKMGRLIEES